MHLPSEYRSQMSSVIYCKRCGNHVIMGAMQKAFAQQDIDPESLVIVAGIGCASRVPFYINAYGVHTLHGRPLPVAIGIKTANRNLKVVVVTGDGDAYGIGGGHVPHATRKNIDLVFVVVDNSVYGMTGGQTSPTTRQGHQTSTTIYGTILEPVSPIFRSLADKVSFVARGTVEHSAQLIDLLQQALAHPGFAMVHVLSRCPTHDKLHYFDEDAARVRDIPPDHDRTSLPAALNLCLDPDHLYTGVFHQVLKPTYNDRADMILAKAKAQKGMTTVEDLLEQYV
ncbi:MAG: 2-oxoacid:ferredoxin oxidoreductase subunit beta [Deltaproteobacteria bacterium]|nr:2-oxoacid:ferredoxin oxidoreductase subunit beta [Deltaproteobacteria bacterium]